MIDAVSGQACETRDCEMTMPTVCGNKETRACGGRPRASENDQPPRPAGERFDLWPLGLAGHLALEHHIPD